MIPKRHIILTGILLVALNLAVSVAYSASLNPVETWNFIITNNWNHVETWSFTLNSKGWNIVEIWNFNLNSVSQWNIVESWNFQLTTVSWNHTDTWNKSIGQSPSILTPVLILFFALTILVATYTLKRGRGNKK